MRDTAILKMAGIQNISSKQKKRIAQKLVLINASFKDKSFPFAFINFLYYITDLIGVKKKSWKNAKTRYIATCFSVKKQV